MARNTTERYVRYYTFGSAAAKLDRDARDPFDLLDELESIVYSGTKINIDYFLEEVMDHEVIDEIFDYFRNEAESDSLEAAMEDLRDDYDEPEVRLVRLKFLCEVAN